MTKIKNIFARQILDSRGNPTIEVEAISIDNLLGRASVPSGASTGSNEAVELRDGEKKYLGKGVINAVENVNKIISPKLKGYSTFDQEKIDNLLIEIDGTSNKSNLGANAILGVSIAVAKLASLSKNIPLFKHLGGENSNLLPIPMINIINGGSHSDSPIAFQEFMIRPVGLNSFKEALRCGAEIFHNLKKLLKKEKYSTAVGDEGGFAPNLINGTEEAIEKIIESVKISGYKIKDEVSIGLDCAASEFYKDDLYDYSIFEGISGEKRSSIEQVDYLEELINNYPIDSIEDGCAENDWYGWEELTKRIGNKCQLVGDDNLVTNVKFLQKAINQKCGNAILIKPNQIGTLTETISAIKMASSAGWSSIISHRSGETEDTTIADLAVAFNTGQIKTGSISRSERIAKYNRLLRIEEYLGNHAKYKSK
tara:strand:+ start:1660 stop:2934 length:1275 start_codon:yes stop_codon:yes gene_type:complete